MYNKAIEMIFRPFDILRVGVKRILTHLRLRDKQSCKRCGRDQVVVWSVSDREWSHVPERYKNRCLCLECYALLVGDLRSLDVFGVCAW